MEGLRSGANRVSGMVICLLPEAQCDTKAVDGCRRDRIRVAVVSEENYAESMRCCNPMFAGCRPLRSDRTRDAGDKEQWEVLDI